jgi:hypothetical protein
MLFCIFCIFCVLCIVCFVSFSVLFVCICVLYYCHLVATQLQLNISYYISYIIHHKSYIISYIIYHISYILSYHIYHIIHSFRSLSYDRSKSSSKVSSPHSAIQSFLFQMRVSSPFFKVIQ